MQENLSFYRLKIDDYILCKPLGNYKENTRRNYTKEKGLKAYQCKTNKTPKIRPKKHNERQQERKGRPKGLQDREVI